MTMYQRYMNGVDRSDRDTADWGIVLRTSRYYLNIVYWVWSMAATFGRHHSLVAEYEYSTVLLFLGVWTRPMLDCCWTMVRV